MPNSAPRRLRQIIDGNQVFAKSCGVDGLFAGWRRVAENAGAAGGDGMSVERFAQGLEERLARLSRELREGAYRPGPLRQVDIPKAKGGVRRLSIPCVADRVAQSAVAQVLSPLLDEEFEDASFAYRPGRGVADAVRRVEALRRAGYVWTLDADIDDYFDSVPVDALMARLAQSVSEGPLLQLTGLWVEHGAQMGRGLPQGSPLSPLLANLYLDGLDEAMSAKGLRIVRYADDFLVLAKDRPALEAARGRVAQLLADHGLRLNESAPVRGYEDSLRFLGHVFVRGWALQSPDGEAETSAERALRELAKADAQEAEAARTLAAGEEAEFDAGLDRGLRVLYLREAGRRLGLRNLSFAVRADDVDGREREIAAIHHARVDRIEIGPQALAEPQALAHALACAIPVAFTDGHGRPLGQLAPSVAQRARRHLAQARHALDPALALDLARRIVRGRIVNQRALLRRVNGRRGIVAVAHACTTLGGLERRVPHIRTMDQLRGYEGLAAKIYWRAFNALLLNGATLPFRLRRQGAGAANIALDVTAGILARDIAAMALSAGLHPGFGVLHASEDHRDACVYDLMEEFRAGLAESVTLTAFNTQTLQLDHFSRLEDRAWRLGNEGMGALIRAYEERAERPTIDPATGQRATWRRLMRLQAERFAAHVEGRETYKPFVLNY